MRQIKYLSGCLALLFIIGAQISPAKEVITPEGFQVVPGSPSRRADQAVPSNDGAVNVVFRAFKRSEGKIAVYFSRLEQGGAWSEPIQISEDGSHCEDPVLAAYADGTLLSAWIDMTVPDRLALTIRRSDDRGKTWTSVLRHPSGVTRAQPIIAVGGKTAYVCFSSSPKGGVGERVYFFRSADGGKTWLEKDVNFKEPRNYSSAADLLVRGETVWVTWCDQDPRGVKNIVLTRSTDEGETWLPDPVVVSDPRPETPSKPMFDDSQPEPVVTVVWRASRPGSAAFIYEDRCDTALACGKDRILFQSEVIPLTYSIVKHGNNRMLLWLSPKGGVSEKQKRLYWVKLDDKSVNVTNQEAVVWPGAEHANFSEFDVQVTKETLHLAAVARFRAGDWRLLLLSRRADGEDQKSTIGEGDRRELSSLALFPLNGDVGWLLQERRPRMFPMESRLNDRLVFGRLGQDQ